MQLSIHQEQKDSMLSCESGEVLVYVEKKLLCSSKIVFGLGTFTKYNDSGSEILHTRLPIQDSKASTLFCVQYSHSIKVLWIIKAARKQTNQTLHLTFSF